MGGLTGEVGVNLPGQRHPSWGTKDLSHSDRFLDTAKENSSSMPLAPRRISSPVSSRDVIGRDGKVQKKKSRNSGTKTNSKTSAKETRLDESSFEVSKCGKTHTGLGRSASASALEAKPARDYRSSEMSKAKKVGSVLSFGVFDWDSALKPSLGLDQKKSGTSLRDQKQKDLSSRTWHSETTSTTLQTKKSSNKTGKPQSAILTNGAIKGSIRSMGQYNIDEWSSDSDTETEDEEKKKQALTSSKKAKQKTEAVVASKPAVRNQKKPAKEKTARKQLKTEFRSPLCA
jgi:hypothetical protein